MPWQMKIAALAVGAPIVLLVAACSSGDDNTKTAGPLEHGGASVSPPPPPIKIPEPTGIPELTDDQKNEAWSIIENDPLNQQLHLAGTPTVKAVGPWLDSDNSLIGVAANISFPPQTIEADWPTFKTGDGQREVVREHHKLINLAEIGVLVDLQNQRLAKVIFVQHDGFDDPPIPSPTATLVGAGSAGAVDACSVLTSAEISAAINETEGGALSHV